MTQPWPQIVARYEDYKGEERSIRALARLAREISESQLAMGLFAWTYDPSHIHQVTAIGANIPFTYDANGNMNDRFYDGPITWTSYNYPSLINYKKGVFMR